MDLSTLPEGAGYLAILALMTLSGVMYILFNRKSSDKESRKALDEAKAVKTAADKLVADIDKKIAEDTSKVSDAGTSAIESGTEKIEASTPDPLDGESVNDYVKATDGKFQ